MRMETCCQRAACAAARVQQQASGLRDGAWQELARQSPSLSGVANRQARL